MNSKKRERSIETIAGQNEDLSSLNYLIGIGRSGSTLLSTMLNAIPEVKAIPEIPITVFFAKHYKTLNGKSIELEKFAQIYLSIYQKVRPLDLVNLNSNSLNFESVSYVNYHGFLSAVFEQFSVAEKSGKTKIVVDKNPYYSFHYKLLKTLSPNPKFVVLVRDYRANVLSRKAKSLNKPSSVVYNAFRWRIFHRKLIRFQGNEDCLVTRYEDLVKKQEIELRRISNFLNIVFDKQAFQDRLVSGVSDSIEDQRTKEFANVHFKGLAEPVYEDRIHAWKTGLTDKEIKIAEQICGKIGLLYGYDLTKKYRNLYVWIVLRYFWFYMRAMYSIYKEYLIYYMPIKLKLKRLQKVTGL